MGTNISMRENRDCTLAYYNKNAEAFIKSTLNVDFLTVQEKFLEKLAVSKSILDFGCGSGRDTICVVRLNPPSEVSIVLAGLSYGSSIAIEPSEKIYSWPLAAFLGSFFAPFKYCHVCLCSFDKHSFVSSLCVTSGCV